ncbi:MAG: fasciclin domain-containing protein [Bacteroidetes bacterium]|nr:fasciclin domain-containing protein [Fibrella sp.]
MTLSFVRLRTLAALALLLMGMVLTGCSDKSTDAQPKTITDIVLENPDFSILKAAVAHAGVGDALKGTNLTLFAPNDAAFQASNLTAAALTALPKDSVRNILLYHVLYTKTLVADVPTGSNPVSTANNQATAYLIKTPTDLFINNARVTLADQPVANGVIHTINRVLTPSRGSLLNLAQRDPALSFLLLAATRAAAANPALISALTTTPVTVFAPTNSAFIAAGYTSPASLNQASVQTLTALLSYHILPGVIFSTQLAAGPVTTLSQASNNRLTVGLTASGITVKGNQNPTAANLLAPPDVDIPITNGVVHKIDQLLRP